MGRARVKQGYHRFVFDRYHTYKKARTISQTFSKYQTFPFSIHYQIFSDFFRIQHFIFYSKFQNFLRVHTIFQARKQITCKNKRKIKNYGLQLQLSPSDPTFDQILVMGRASSAVSAYTLVWTGVAGAGWGQLL